MNLGLNNKPVSFSLQIAQKIPVAPKIETRPTMFDREDF